MSLTKILAEKTVFVQELSNKSGSRLPPASRCNSYFKNQYDVSNGFCGILIDALNFFDVIFEQGNFKTQTHTLLPFHAQFGVLVLQKVF